jgi:hypothetical protein
MDLASPFCIIQLLKLRTESPFVYILQVLDDVLVRSEWNMKFRSQQTSLLTDSYHLSISPDSFTNLKRIQEMS